jgi:hypothetical protein
LRTSATRHYGVIGIGLTLCPIKPDEIYVEAVIAERKNA